MEINGAAPVYARQELAVDAPISVVWDVLTNVNDWPRWNAGVKSASLAGPVAIGTVFRWKAGPGTIASSIEDVEPPHSVGWTGRTLGLSAIHIWRLGEQDDGRTHITTEESMQGPVARVLRGTVQKNVERSLEAWLQGLKAESEARSS